ncbi:hypothetical protein HMPREF9056_01644 [Actinomyces sp. oral taxon 170 str. F0386]|nr:hypothetical protein HMPREF9056_01644 [Actinomyces sp. oral taxon 170 str. F0386]
MAHRRLLPLTVIHATNTPTSPTVRNLLQSATYSPITPDRSDHL